MKRPPAALVASTVLCIVAGAAVVACSRSPLSTSSPTVAPLVTTPTMPVPVPGARVPPPVPARRPTPEGPAMVGSPEVAPAVVASPEVPPATVATPGLGGVTQDPDVGGAVRNPTDPFGAPPAPLLDPRRFTEAHWQGLEVVPKTAALAKALGIPNDIAGVVVDDVTLPADLQGFEAGDLVVGVAQVPTADLLSFVEATARVRDRRRAEVEVWRKGDVQVLVLTALMTRLGAANGETPSMIPPGSRMPHRYRGPCTNCHKIGTNGQLAVDPGDLTATTAPTIRLGATRPHRDFGPCTACHRIQP